MNYRINTVEKNIEKARENIQKGLKTGRKIFKDQQFMNTFMHSSMRKSAGLVEEEWPYILDEALTQTMTENVGSSSRRALEN